MGVKKNVSQVLENQGAAPSQVANSVRVYAKSVSGSSEFFVLDSDGNEVQVTSAGVVAGGSMAWSSTVTTGTITTAVVNQVNRYIPTADGLTGFIFPDNPSDGDLIAFKNVSLTPGAVNFDAGSATPSAQVELPFQTVPSTVSSGFAAEAGFFFALFKYNAADTVWYLQQPASGSNLDITTTQVYYASPETLPSYTRSGAQFSAGELYTATANGNLIWDGVTISLDASVLIIYDDIDGGLRCGHFVMVDEGSESTPWVLRRLNSGFRRYLIISGRWAGVGFIVGAQNGGVQPVVDRFGPPGNFLPTGSHNIAPHKQHLVDLGNGGDLTLNLYSSSVAADPLPGALLDIQVIGTGGLGDDLIIDAGLQTIEDPTSPGTFTSPLTIASPSLGNYQWMMSGGKWYLKHSP